MVQFLHHPQYVDNDILVLFHLLDRLNPSRPEHRLTDICNLVSLTQGSHEETVEYMARVRGFDARLNKVTLGEVMNIFFLLGMTDNKYDGIMSCYAAGDSVVVTANLTTLKRLMMGEDERKNILDLAPTMAPPPTMLHVPLKPPRKYPLQYQLRIT